LERRLAAVAASHPALALRAAGGLGRLRNRLSAAWPSPRQVALLFPHLDRAAAARIAWNIGGLECRNRLGVEILRRGGIAALLPLLRQPSALAALRPPLVLGFFHIGAMQGLGAALARLPAPVLAFRLGLLTSGQPPLEIVSTAGDVEARAAAFHRGLDHLRRPGFVAMALDLPATRGLAAPCLGRQLALSRGPFALARLAGCPLVPIAARWRQGKLETVHGAPLAANLTAPQPGAEPGRDAGQVGRHDAGPGTTAAEAPLARAAARWLENYLLAAPADLSLGLLRDLLAAETAPPVQ
jgi:hypothetical protein